MRPLHEMYKVNEAGCWMWQLAIDPNGYGHITRNRRRWGGHRWIYTQLRGPIPAGMHLDHLCEVRACVNPDHLTVGTAWDNIKRGMSPAAQNARRTHCTHGHLLSGSNLRLSLRANGNVRRTCRACQSRAQREYMGRRAQTHPAEAVA